MTTPGDSPFRDAEAMREAMRRVAAEHGPWTTPIDLGFGIVSCDAAADSSEGTRLPRILRAVEDLAGDLRGLRVLDLGCLEGAVSVALARRGASVLGIEARESNLARARFARQALDLRNLEFVLDDVRNLSVSRYGEHDLVLCLGILYHLPASDVFALVPRLHEVARRLALIDTHVSLTETSRPLLGPLRPFEHAGETYWGRDYVEFGPESRLEERLKAAWATLDARPSFWPTRPSLFNLLARAGFTSLFEAHEPVWRGMPADRLMVAALKGSPHGDGAPKTAREPFPGD
jgi:SAM-dependent methyltransferase